MRIEAYFDYKWANDRNQFLHLEHEQAIMDQLPNHVQDRILNKFMYGKFLKKFENIFQIEMDKSTSNHSCYTWDNYNYRSFMIALLHGLQPRKYDKGELIYTQLEEINEVIFVERGNIDVGFEVSYKKKFVVRLFDHSVIGAYNCANHSKTLYIYKNQSENFQGWSIKKATWIDLMTNYEDISKKVLKQFEDFFQAKIQVPVEQEKMRFISRLH